MPPPPFPALSILAAAPPAARAPLRSLQESPPPGVRLHLLGVQPGTAAGLRELVAEFDAVLAFGAPEVAAAAEATGVPAVSVEPGGPLAPALAALCRRAAAARTPLAALDGARRRPQ